MKKLNRKGFTLVELLVVLVILVVIMSVAIPSISASLERNKQKQYDSKMEIIMSAAEIYIDRHRNTFSDNNARYQIFVKNLICDGLLTKEQAKDPFNEQYTLNGYIEVYNNTYNWIEAPDGDYYKIKIDDNLTCE